MGSIASGERCGGSLISTSKDNDRSISTSTTKKEKDFSFLQSPTREIIGGGKHYCSEFMLCIGVNMYNYYNMPRAHNC